MYTLPWVSILSVIVFVFGIGSLFEMINTRTRRVYEKLKSFIEQSDEFSIKGIEVSAGPYGAYILFAVPKAKT